MSVYKKLMEARIRLQDAGLSKSGKNAYAGYEYFELGDFLPKTMEIFNEIGLCSVVSYGIESATLEIFDIAKPDSVIRFDSPMAEANLKGCHPIQNLGAVETYQRRYLYVTALEIVEHDALDATHGRDKVDPVKKVTDTFPGSKVVDVDVMEKELLAADTLDKLKTVWKNQHKERRELEDVGETEKVSYITAVKDQQKIDIEKGG